MHTVTHVICKLVCLCTRAYVCAFASVCNYVGECVGERLSLQCVFAQAFMSVFVDVTGTVFIYIVCYFYLSWSVNIVDVYVVMY